MARSKISIRTCPYTAIVNASEASPRLRDTTVGCTPRSIMSLAAACLRSWRRVDGAPTWAANRLNAVENVSGRVAAHPRAPKPSRDRSMPDRLRVGVLPAQTSNAAACQQPSEESQRRPASVWPSPWRCGHPAMRPGLLGWGEAEPVVDGFDRIAVLYDAEHVGHLRPDPTRTLGASGR